MPANRKLEQTQTPPPRPMGFGPGRGGPGGPGGFGMTFEKPKDAKRTLARLVRYLGGNIPILAGILCFSAITALITIVATRINGMVVDNYIARQDIRGLGIICLILLGIYLFGVAAAYLQERLMARLSQTTTATIRRDLFGHIGGLPLGYYDTHSSGDLMSRLTNDVDTIGQTMSQNVTQLFSGIINIVGTLIAMLLLSPFLTLVTVAVVPFMILFTRFITKITRKLFKRQSTELGALNGYIEEIVSGEKVVQLFSREEKAREEFRELNQRLRKSGTLAQCVSGLMGPMMNCINNVSYLAVAVAGGWMVVQGRVSVGIVFSFLQYKRQFSNPINQIANLFNTIQSALAAAERIFEVMDQTPEQDPADAAEIEAMRGDIAFEDVTFSYIPGTPVLKNAHITAKSGEQVAIVGPTGAGKTTIISLLTRFYDIDSGRVLIDGMDAHKISRHSLRKKVGMVLQDTYLFSETVRDNIRYGAPDATDAEVEEAAKLANADQFIIHLPRGYDTVLQDNGGNLSQGQRQLLAIARAILADPQVLILDEATSSVDTRTEIHIQQALLNLMKGRTSFIIAHRLSTIRNADKILVINSGEIVESGTHTELLGITDGFYAHLYNVQYTTGMAI
ncbi:multidrug ABC transporter ATP-binding protein [Spirochaetia bacterium]|nr:multidrug ABC transporter ATP-binding protein [Spirochaetia bacterium]